MDIDFLKARKKELHLSYDEIAAKSGIPKTTVTNIFMGRTQNPRIDTVQAIEKALGLDRPAMPNEVELDDLFPIPLLGAVVAGVPIEAQENLEGYIYISYRPKEEYFALRVHGQSMKNVGIFDKSVVVCHKQENAESGEIVVAMLNGEQTVKRLRLIDKRIVLMPENPDFDPIFISEKDELIILGKVIEVRMQL